MSRRNSSTRRALSSSGLAAAATQRCRLNSVLTFSPSTARWASHSKA